MTVHEIGQYRDAEYSLFETPISNRSSVWSSRYRRVLCRHRSAGDVTGSVQISGFHAKVNEFNH
jgi:hypothetical protein